MISILQSLELHGYSVRSHPNPRLKVWEVSAKGYYWVIAQVEQRLLSPTPWLQSWIDSVEDT